MNHCRKVATGGDLSKVTTDQLPPNQDATTATSYIIDSFGMRDLFGRENYEYYARLTGRILKVTLNSTLTLNLTPVTKTRWKMSGFSSPTLWTALAYAATLTSI